mgnify:CR=1 FL=1
MKKDEAPTARAVTPTLEDGEDAVERSLRPRLFEEYVGQTRVKENLRVYCAAARKRGEPLDHVLLAGPPGLGKTTLAYILGNELGVQLQVTSGPALENRALLAGHLTNLGERDILFIDEIHRLQPAVEEYLYPAMEDFVIDIAQGAGAYTPTLRIPLKPFTLIGATTRTGLLASPLRDRFGIVERLDYYSHDELFTIVRRSADILSVRLDEDGGREIGRRARGTPRIANRLLRRVRDFVEVGGDGRITQASADGALARLEVDAAGLDAMDRRLLRTIIEKFDGGPVGVESLAVAVGEEADTIEDVYEPFLIQGGWLARTPRGRMATRHGWEHLGLPPPERGQGSLF